MISKTKKIGKYLAPYANNYSYSIEEKEQLLSYSSKLFFKNLKWIAMLTLLILIISNFIEIKLTTPIVLITYMMIRRCFGGYHASSEIVCLMISLIVPIIGGIAAVYINFNIYIILTIYLFAIVTIKNKGVVDNPRKRFNDENKRFTLKLKRMFYIQGIITSIIIFLIHMMLYKYNLKLSNAISIGVFISFFNLYFGK